MSENIKMQRGYIALEDGNFEKASSYFDDALNENPYESGAYWGLLLCDMFCTDKAELLSLGIDFSGNKNYEKAIRYGNDSQKEEYQEILKLSIRTGQQKLIEMLQQKDYKTAYLRTKNSGENPPTFPEAVARLYYISNDFQKLSIETNQLNSAVLKLENATAYRDLFEQIFGGITVFDTVTEYQERIKEHKRIIEEETQRKIEENKKRQIEEKRRKQAEQKRREEERIKKEAEEKRKKAEAERIAEEERRIYEKQEARKRIGCWALVIIVIFSFTILPPLLNLIIDKTKQNKIASISDEYFISQYAQLKAAQVGDTVTYGYAHEKEWKSLNENREIEWIVLDKQDGKILLITKSWLYKGSFESSVDSTWDNTKISWEHCSLRDSLNTWVFENAFVGKTASHILDTETSAGIYDKLFLLSYDEVVKYFGINDGDRIISDYGCLSGYYWIRSSNTGEECQFIVYSSGSFGFESAKHELCIRPAIWVNISE